MPVNQIIYHYIADILAKDENYMKTNLPGSKTDAYWILMTRKGLLVMEDANSGVRL